MESVGGGHRHVVVDDRARRTPVLQGRAAGVSQRHQERLVRLVERVVLRRHRDDLPRSAGREGERTRCGVEVLADGCRSADCPVAHRHGLFARRAEPYREARRLSLDHRGIHNGKRRQRHRHSHVVVDDRARRTPVLQGRADRVVQPHRERFVRLVQLVLARRHRDALTSVAGREGERARCGVKVPARDGCPRWLSGSSPSRSVRSPGLALP